MHDAFKTWDWASETVEDTERRIHDGVPVEQLRPRANRYIDALSAYFPWSVPHPEGHVVEIGSGLAYVMETAARRFRPRMLTGIDVAPAMVAKAKARLHRDQIDDPRLQFLVYDGISIPLADDSVDYVYSVATLQHIPKPYVFNLMFEIKRIMSPSGFCALHFLAYSQLRSQVKAIPFAEDVRRQLAGAESHWHHFYSFDELLHVLADGIDVKEIDIVEDEALWVSFGKRGATFHRPRLPEETHVGSACHRGTRAPGGNPPTTDTAEAVRQGMVRATMDAVGRRFRLGARPTERTPHSHQYEHASRASLHACLDRFEIFAGALRLTGWAFSEQGPGILYFDCSDGHRYPITSYGLPSADVGGRHGPAAANVRFDEFLRLHGDGPGVDSGTLVLITGDGMEIGAAIRRNG